jgi:hypothetical protein
MLKWMIFRDYANMVDFWGLTMFLRYHQNPEAIVFRI